MFLYIFPEKRKIGKIQFARYLLNAFLSMVHHIDDVFHHILVYDACRLLSSCLLTHIREIFRGYIQALCIV